ncbi:MAG: hypothetical protein P4M07_23515 [Xanthobacteraceae bacterium]|nr:hypothetical protein [Xanthobacteraceae bacterium]
MKALRTLFWQTLKAACVVAGLVAAAPASHAQTGPFTGLEGNWSGGGTILVGDNGSERIRCRANYEVDGQGNNLHQAIRCASDSYRFELSSSVIAEGGRLTGAWQEATRNVGGNIEGRAGRGQYNAIVTGVGFSASLSMVTRGTRQTISINSKDATNLRGVQISLNR